MYLLMPIYICPFFDRIFVADTENFSFWSDDESHKYCIKYNGKEYTCRLLVLVCCPQQSSKGQGSKVITRNQRLDICELYCYISHQRDSGICFKFSSLSYQFYLIFLGAMFEHSC